MFYLALRQLLLDPARTSLTGLAVAAVVAVILVLEGFGHGLYQQLRRAVLDRGADLIVTQAGVANLLAARSSLPQLTRAEVEAVPGVAQAHPLTAIPVIYHQDEQKRPIYVWVYDTRGGPLSIVSGRPVSEGRDIVIDRALAHEFGLAPGDPFIVSDFTFEVAGITPDAAALFTSFAFVSYDGMIDLFLESDIAPDLSTFPLLSFLLVELEPGADPDQVERTLEDRVPVADVFTPSVLAARDEQLGRDLFGPIMDFLVAIAYLIGLLVVGLVSFADTRGRQRSFGVLKALGFSDAALARLVLLQTLLLVLTAFPIGVALALGLAAFIHWATPLYLVLVLVPASLSTTLLAGLAFALLGAVLPIRLVARQDPTIVFAGV